MSAHTFSSMAWSEGLGMIVAKRIESGELPEAFLMSKGFPLLMDDIESLLSATGTGVSIDVIMDCRDLFDIGSLSWRVLDGKLAAMEMLHSPD